MTSRRFRPHARPRALGLLAVLLASAATLAACGGDEPGASAALAAAPSANSVFQVGTTTVDPNLPAEPALPTDAQVCSTLEASNTLVSRPDGSLPPEADPSPSGVGKAVSTATANPDQARIQAALDACGAAVDAEVGAAIAAADAAATASQKAAAVPNVNLAGASGETLAQPKYRASKFAVRLVVNHAGAGNGFISGPLTLPSGVTLWIDKGVTLYASRDVKAYAPNVAGPYCGNTAVSATKAGSSSNCLALITGTNLVNAAVVGDGRIDGRGYAELVTSDAKYPLMKVDMTCSNTYAAYRNGTVAPDGTACDDGGTVVDSKSTVRNMTWWDLAYLGNMVQNGTTGFGSQSNFRLMVFNYAKNLTLYRITLNNSPNFHVVPSGIDGLTVWNVKVQTPTLAAFANPAGNGNPLYNGQTFNADNVKNTDAFDPGSASKPISAALSTGSTTTSASPVSFDGYLKNVVFAYNYVSTGDDDIALKGGNNPSPAGSQLPGIDGNRDVRADRKWGIAIAHNHIYWGHGISIGSETNGGVTNVQVYDNSFQDSEEGLRIKSDYARGGEVSQIHYANICIRDAKNALLFTPYYSTKAVPAGGPLYPNFHDISIANVAIFGEAGVKLQGFEANTGGYGEPAFPLAMTLTDVVADTPDSISVIASDANLTLRNVNLPIFASTANRVVVDGTATHNARPANVVDCSKAFVDFPGIDQSNPFGTTWAPSL
ncbi:glycosyl hydrolase family 28 protein [Burkholderia multivorans]|uniref:glycoside hydrolase family 28 protein n=1 Tax=Burkholderia multivorans TaxID=87883 RepID=UPI000D37E9E6|nr:glycosyl hydrolase family 28 protein [Burkholderia multivorans]MBR8022042.1 endopolygalacturonase [Burkholderia multivorans]MEB2512289.1 glycosyl hydrolase family 28 protein [Burkholderia multivorans]MEB2523663.1 glycosyl hydrolase family 28 protein [Burkholderia multivorans]MEB2575169.1 glycosyl hydrolase family 28 protein [Burkholderia multivorans]MEB2591472.1 glycosyl hydrolase family 28 protein [Burkholderia multivorans]